MEFINLLLPIFAIILTGFAVAHFKLLPESLGDVLIQFAFNIGLPALLFLVIAQESASRLLNGAFFASYGGGNFFFFGAVLAFALWWRKKSLGDGTILALLAACSNTAFVALPVLKAVFGHKAVLPAAIASVIMMTMVLIAVVLIERSRPAGPSGRASLWPHIRKVLLNPLILAPFLGVAYALIGWPLPVIAVNFLTLLGDSVTPCALFAVGMSIKLQSIKDRAGAILLLSGLKLIIIPAVVLVLAQLFQLDPFFSVAAVISAAVPTAKTVFVLAAKYDHSKELAAETVSTGTLLSTLTLFLWLLVLSHFYPSAFLSN
ncbi:MAG: AEC family transporter [Pseudomonadota bacterium]